MCCKIFGFVWVGTNSGLNWTTITINNDDMYSVGLYVLTHFAFHGKLTQ